MGSGGRSSSRSTTAWFGSRDPARCPSGPVRARCRPVRRRGHRTGRRPCPFTGRVGAGFRARGADSGSPFGAHPVSAATLLRGIRHRAPAHGVGLIGRSAWWIESVSLTPPCGAAGKAKRSCSGEARPGFESRRPLTGRADGSIRSGVVSEFGSAGEARSRWRCSLAECTPRGNPSKPPHRFRGPEPSPAPEASGMCPWALALASRLGAPDASCFITADSRPQQTLVGGGALDAIFSCLHARESPPPMRPGAWRPRHASSRSACRRRPPHPVLSARPRHGPR